MMTCVNKIRSYLSLSFFIVAGCAAILCCVNVIAFSISDKPCSEFSGDRQECIKLFKQGMLYLDQQDWVKAENKFTKLLSVAPDNKHALFNRAFAKAAGGQKREAIVDLITLEKLAPNYSALYEERALIYFELKDYRKAIDDYSKSIVMEGGSVSAYRFRGLSYYGLSDFANARKDFTRALSLIERDKASISINAFELDSPIERKLRIFIANTYYFSEQYGEAIKAYQYIINRDPMEYRAVNGLAWLYLTSKNKQYLNPRYGLKLAIRASKISKGSDADTMDTLAYAYHVIGDNQKAVKVIETAIKMHPDDNGLHKAYKKYKEESKRQVKHPKFR